MGKKKRKKIGEERSEARNDKLFQFIAQIIITSKILQII